MTSQERKAFGQRMTGGYEAPILAESRGGPIPEPGQIPPGERRGSRSPNPSK